MSNIASRSPSDDLSASCLNHAVALSFYQTVPALAGLSTITLLFIHGLESSKETWKETTENLKDTYRIFAIDLRGHGETPIGNGDFSTDQLVADIEKFVLERKIHQFVVVAHSMGARVAIPYAARYPEKVQGLVIEDMEVRERPKKNIDPSEIERFKQFQSTQPDLESVNKELEKYGYNPERAKSWLKQERIKLTGDGNYFIGVHPYVAHQVRQCLSYSEVSLNAFKELQCPILLLKAENHSSISHEGLEQMKELQPSMIFEEVKGSEHSIHRTAQESFLQQVNEFLKHL